MTATVDGQSWETSVWRDKKFGTLLAVPKKIRGDKGDGDIVEIELSPRGVQQTSRRPQR